MIFLYSDVISRSGGIETYLHALALYLHKSQIPLEVVYKETLACPLLDDLRQVGIPLHRVPAFGGDRIGLGRWWLAWFTARRVKPGDWVFCVRQPMAPFYLALVRWVHRRGGKIAVSWMLTPEFLEIESRYSVRFNRAVQETDAVISVSDAGVAQYPKKYDYMGEVKVVPYHNQLLFPEVAPLPDGPPWKFGYMGRIDRQQKNLDAVIQAFAQLHREEPQTEFHFWGRGPNYEVEPLKQLSRRLGVEGRVIFHGEYDHRRDLSSIVAGCHLFTYLSRAEGGPCFTLLELMQAGRFCIASNVGGIPDIYTHHPECGLLVDQVDVSSLTVVMKEALELLRNGKIEPEVIRQSYLDRFSMPVAHRAWLSALGIGVPPTESLG